MNLVLDDSSQKNFISLPNSFSFLKYIKVTYKLNLFCSLFI